MTIPIVVLNGGSSSGKSSIARCLQKLLGPTWMTLGVDDLIRAMPGGEKVEDLVAVPQEADQPATTGPSSSAATGPSS